MNHEERHRAPEGHFMVEAFMNDQGRLVIMGEPDQDWDIDGEDPGHNCDEMGCGSFDHVACVVQLGNQRQINEAMNRAKFLDKLALQREIAQLTERFSSMTCDPFQRVIHQRIVELSQKLAAMEAHPDLGGSHEQMQRLNRAMDQARKELEQ